MELSVGSLRLAKALAEVVPDMVARPVARNGGRAISQISAEQREVVRRNLARVYGPEINDAELRARWLVRVLISLLQFPGRDDDDERLMLERFVVPQVAGLPQAAQ